MIISRLVHVCRIILTTLYTISFLVSCIALPLLIGLIVQEFGYLDKVDTRVITCTTRDKSDGQELFHGEAYVRPSVSELEQIRLTCEEEKEKREVTDKYYTHEPSITNPFLKNFGDQYPSRERVGYFHEIDAQKYFDTACSDKNDGTELEKTNVTRSYLIDPDHVVFLLMSIPISLLLYLMGYVFFGEKMILPIRKFKKIQSP